MTDLSKGIIELEEMTITPETTKQEFDEKFGPVISPASCQTIVYLLKLSAVDNTLFGATFMFNDNGHISSVKLSPYIKYKSEKWDRTGMQEERRQFCDQWLFERLGEPGRNLGGAEYVFDNLRISCVTHFDLHNGADAGYIVITYLR